MINFSAIVKPVLLQILGEPNQQLSTAKELRFGRKGSLSVDPLKGIWSDFETGDSGGFFGLIKQKTGTDDPMQWLRQHGYATDTRGQSGKAQKEVSHSSLKPATAPTKQTATYTYATESGEPLYRVLRSYDDQGQRQFKQQRFDNNSGAWLNGLKGVQGNSAVTKTLYNLAELVSKTDKPVMIVEGEKDCETLKRFGLLATTSGGSNSWKPEFAQWLRGRDVVVIPDHDSAGAKYADTVTQSLKGIAKSIKRIDLAKHWTQCPPKGDVTDFIEAGASLDDLNRIIQQSPFEGEPATAMQVKPAVTFARIGDALKNAMKPIPWLVEGFFIKDTLAALVGKPSSGKSLISLSLAASIATGADWFGHKTQKGTVVYLAGEGQWGISRRLMAWSKHHNISLDEADLYLSDHAVMVDQPKAIVDTADAIRALSDTPPSLIVIDTLHRSFSGDENSASDMAAFIQGCDYLRTQFPNAVVLVVHHSGHGNEVRARGSSSFHAALDTSYTVEGADSVKVMTQNKTKDGKPAQPINFVVKEVDIYETHEGVEQSITIEQTNDTAATVKQLSKSLAFAIQTFAAVSYRHKVDLSRWRDEYYTRHHGESSEAKKKAFSRVRKDLVEAGIMRVSEGDVYELVQGNPYEAFTKGIMIAANFKKAQGEVGNDDRFHEKDEA